LVSVTTKKVKGAEKRLTLLVAAGDVTDALKTTPLVGALLPTTTAKA